MMIKCVGTAYLRYCLTTLLELSVEKCGIGKPSKGYLLELYDRARVRVSDFGVTGARRLGATGAKGASG